MSQTKMSERSGYQVSSMQKSDLAILYNPEACIALVKQLQQCNYYRKEIYSTALFRL